MNDPSSKPSSSSESYVGLPIAEAQGLANARGLQNRVVSVDGQPRPVTKDMRPDRLNFSVVKGRVVKVTKG